MNADISKNYFNDTNNTEWTSISGVSKLQIKQSN